MEWSAILDRHGVLTGYDESGAGDGPPVPANCDLALYRYRWDGTSFQPLLSQVEPDHRPSGSTQWMGILLCFFPKWGWLQKATTLSAFSSTQKRFGIGVIQAHENKVLKHQLLLVKQATSLRESLAESTILILVAPALAGCIALVWGKSFQQVRHTFLTIIPWILLALAILSQNTSIQPRWKSIDGNTVIEEIESKIRIVIAAVFVFFSALSLQFG